MTDSGHNSEPQPTGSPRTPETASAPSGTPHPATWAALLARWVEFARAAVALPRDEEGNRWRRGVPPIITLQAVTHALAEIDGLPTGQQALALDRSAVLIRDNAATLHRLWGADPLPERLIELIDDARRALDAAAARGRHWLVGEARYVMPALDDVVEALLARGFEGDLFGALPGTILFHGEPALLARPDADLSITGLERAERSAPALQIYRQVEPETGRVARDLVAPLHASLPPGRPLLVTLVEGGRATDALRDHDAEAWHALQRRLLPDDPIPISYEQTV